ncbi:IS66 family insertion sequence element accessory protein TnpA [Oceanobacillus bengalensis]|uniref:IS66 family insertion sequence element accessory protein TnpB n=2 Tax=Oceanobacillus bengalensis TaxID=1435466 RepID=A0A494YR42_9BACI|nr:hypothetical protein [Oceanobacillus bengalensis]RKQ11298.1 IS66 family insertion sequence hypothetical protein [Oceanobacillus bengalensis]
MNDADKRIKWKARFDDWQSSGLIVAEWCREQNVNVHQMYYWIRKFKGELPPSEEPETKWLTVNVQDLPPVHTDQESVLIHIGMLSLEVRPGTNMELLSNVMRVVQNQ